MVKYPTLIYSDENGMEAITQGHNLSPETIAEVQAAMIGEPVDGWFTEVQEVYFDYYPRVKRCERLTGWPCEREGDWHGHWVEVLPNEHPETHFTLIRHTDVDPEGDTNG